VGVNIAPLLAGAGALGLAISFGAQTLVKDIITGIFIQFENGMNTGDLVTIGPLTGTVERMSIRSVGVRQDTGAYHIIPWSSITTFANFVRGIGSVVANYDVDDKRIWIKPPGAEKCGCRRDGPGGDSRAGDWRAVICRACRAEQYGLYPARHLHHPAAEAVDGTLCARHPGEKHFDLADTGAGANLPGSAASATAAPPAEPTL
jgi:hypothetical protein